MSKIVAVLFALVCVSCAVHYFPIEPAASVQSVEKARSSLGFDVDRPAGWIQVDRQKTSYARWLVLSDKEGHFQVRVEMFVSGESMETVLDRQWSTDKTAGLKPKMIESAGRQGNYYTYDSKERHYFVGARSYESCGKNARCVVVVNTYWPKQREDEGHTAVRTVVESFRFTR